MALIDGVKFTGRPDPILQFMYICPHCRYNCTPVKTVNETEMICPVCGRHLMRGDIHDRMTKKKKHFFISRIQKIPLIGGRI